MFVTLMFVFVFVFAASLNCRLSQCGHFGAQSHGLHTRCLRFVVPVTRSPRKTRFRMVANLSRVGFQPTGSLSQFQSNFLLLIPSDQAFPGAQRPDPVFFDPNIPNYQLLFHPASVVLGNEEVLRPVQRLAFYPSIGFSDHVDVPVGIGGDSGAFGVNDARILTTLVYTLFPLLSNLVRNASITPILLPSSPPLVSPVT